MKKTIWILAAVAVVLCVFLAACGGNDDNAGTDLMTDAQDMMTHAGDAVSDAGDAVGEAAQDAGDAVAMRSPTQVMRPAILCPARATLRKISLRGAGDAVSDAVS